MTELVLKILYASEEEKVEIDEKGNLKIVPLNEDESLAKNDEELLNEEEAKE